MTKTERVVAFLESGDEAPLFSNREIGRRLGVSSSLVARVRKAMGLQVPRRLVRIGGELRWMTTATIGRAGASSVAHRLVGDAWLAYEEAGEPAPRVQRMFAELYDELAP